MSGGNRLCLFKQKFHRFFAVLAFKKTKITFRILRIDRQNRPAHGSASLIQNQQGKHREIMAEHMSPLQNPAFFLRLLHDFFFCIKPAGKLQKFTDKLFVPGEFRYRITHLIRPPGTSGFMQICRICL